MPSAQIGNSLRRNSGHLLRPDGAAGRAHCRLRCALEGEHRRLLVDAHPLFAAHAGEPAGEQRRLHGRGTGLEHACDVRPRAGAPLHLVRRELLERLQAEPIQRADGAAPGIQLRAAARSPQPAVVAKVGIDAVLCAELADRAHGVLGFPDQAHGLLAAAQRQQDRHLRRPGHAKAAVSPRRTPAADVALDDGNVDRGLQLLDPERGPQAREPAAHDQHVGRKIARQRLRRRRLVRQRFLQPVAPDDLLCHHARAIPGFIAAPFSFVTRFIIEPLPGQADRVQGGRR
jgi:hypothetical protein